MKAELRKYKSYPRFSEETVAFDAVLYLDGKRAGTATNNGHGEGNWVRWENDAMRVAFGEFLKTIPPREQMTFCCKAASTIIEGVLSCKRCFKEVEHGEGDGSVKYLACEDEFIGQLVDAKEEERFEKLKAKQEARFVAKARAAGFIAASAFYKRSNGDEVEMLLSFRPSEDLALVAQRHAPRGCEFQRADVLDAVMSP